MDGEKAVKRVKIIERWQAKLQESVIKLGNSLYVLVSGAAKDLLENPKNIADVLEDFQGAYHFPVVEQFAADIMGITDLNVTYFQDAIESEVSKAIFDRTAKKVLDFTKERFGLAGTEKLTLTKDGFLKSFYEATPVKQEMRQLAYNAKVSNMGVTAFKKELKELVQGVETSTAKSPGVLERYYETYAYDTYQQADRAAQQIFNEEIKLTAAIYTGGLIKTSRPFCVARNGKVFLNEEIEKFGTPEDKYGGYSNKARGEFAGKPRTAYNPFTSLGGHRCMHSLSYISNREALRRREDLEIVNGVLKIKS